MLANNLEIEIAKQSLSIYKEYQKEANLKGLPQVNLVVNSKADYFSENGFYGDRGTKMEATLDAKKIEDYSASLNVNWDIDFYGTTKNKKKIAYYNNLKAQMELHSLQLALIVTTAQTFNYIQLLKRELEVVDKNLAINERIIKMMQAQFSNGNASILAVQEAERQYYFMEGQLPALVQAIQIHENYLNRLRGKNPGESLAITPTKLIENKEILVGVPSDLLVKRADLKKKAYEIEIAYAELGINKANLYPSFAITTNQGLNSMRVSDWFNPASFLSQFVGQLTQPLFNQRRYKTAVKVQEVQVQQKIIGFKSTYLLAVNEVSDALTKIEQLNKKREILNKEFELLQQASKNATLLFKNGEALYFEVLNTQQHVLENELQIAESEGAINTAYIQLYAALGVSDI